MAELCFNTFNLSAWHGVEPRLIEQIDAAADAGFRLFGPDVFSLDAQVIDDPLTGTPLVLPVPKPRAAPPVELLVDEEAAAHAHG